MSQLSTYLTFFLLIIACSLLFLVTLFIIHILLAIMQHIQLFKDNERRNSATKDVLLFLSEVLILIGIQKYVGIGSMSFFIIFSMIYYLVLVSTKSSFQSISSGLSIKIMKLYKKGDLVNIDNKNGVVNDFNLGFTKLENYKGDIFIIPNQKTIYPKIFNYTNHHIDRVLLTIQFSQNINNQELDLLLCEQLSTIKDVLRKPIPSIYIDSKNDANLLSIEVWALEKDIVYVNKKVLSIVKAVFDELKVRMKFPERGFEIIKN